MRAMPTTSSTEAGKKGSMCVAFLRDVSDLPPIGKAPGGLPEELDLPSDG